MNSRLRFLSAINQKSKKWYNEHSIIIIDLGGKGVKFEPLFKVKTSI